MLTSEENYFKNLGLDKHWFSQTTKNIPMISCIYFTATRNITACDVIHVFQNILNIGKVYEEYLNIVPVLNKNYNHVFFKIQWNDTIETANFVNELIINSSIKVYHNNGYWVCRMSKNPLKMRISKKRLNFASFYCDETSSSSSSEYSRESESESQEQNVNMQIKEIGVSKEEQQEREEQEDFYVIKEIKEEINATIE